MDDRNLLKGHDPQGGLPIVALHASASHPGQWSELGLAASDTNTVHPVDLPGYAGRPCGSAPGYGLHRRTAPLIAEIARYGHKVHLVGHSFGGAVATAVAIERPDLVASLSVYEPTLFQILAQSRRPGDREAMRGIRAVAARMTAALACDQPVVAARGFVDYWNGPGCFDHLTSRQRTLLCGAVPDVIADFEDIFADRMAAVSLLTLEVPTFLLSGSKSPLAARSTVDLISRAVPNLTEMRLAGLGHMAPVTSPATIAAAIMDHVRGVEAVGALRMVA